LGQSARAVETLAAALKADYWVAWHQENRSKALHEYIQSVKNNAARLPLTR
jgi:hypothetical protein